MPEGESKPDPSSLDAVEKVGGAIPLGAGEPVDGVLETESTGNTDEVGKPPIEPEEGETTEEAKAPAAEEPAPDTETPTTDEPTGTTDAIVSPETAKLTPEQIKEKINHILVEREIEDRKRIDRELDRLTGEKSENKFVNWVRNSKTTKFIGTVVLSGTAGATIRLLAKNAGATNIIAAGIAGVVIGAAKPLIREKFAERARIKNANEIAKNLKEILGTTEESEQQKQIYDSLESLLISKAIDGKKLAKEMLKGAVWGGLAAVVSYEVANYLLGLAPDYSGGGAGGVGPDSGPGAPGGVPHGSENILPNGPAGPVSPGDMSPIPGEQSGMPFSEYWKHHIEASAQSTSTEHAAHINSYVLEGNGGDIHVDGEHMNNLANAATEGKGWHDLVNAVKENATTHSQESAKEIWNNLTTHDIDPTAQIQGKSVIEYVQELGSRVENPEISKGLYHFLSNSDHINSLSPDKIDFSNMNPEEFAKTMGDYGNNPSVFLNHFNLDAGSHLTTPILTPDRLGPEGLTPGSIGTESATASVGDAIAGGGTAPPVPQGAKEIAEKGFSKFGKKAGLLLGILGISAGAIYLRNRSKKNETSAETEGSSATKTETAKETPVSYESWGADFNAGLNDLNRDGTNSLLTLLDALGNGSEFDPSTSDLFVEGTNIRLGDRLLDPNKVKFTKEGGEISISYISEGSTQTIKWNKEKVELGVYESKTGSKTATTEDIDEEKEKESTDSKPKCIERNQIWKISDKRYLVTGATISGSNEHPTATVDFIEIDKGNEPIKGHTMSKGGDMKAMIDIMEYGGTL